MTDEHPGHIAGCIRALSRWMMAKGQTKPPEPMPHRVEDAAHWWCDYMQEPAREEESNYASRVTVALMGWLSLDPEDRKTVAAGVIDDKVPYRGDTIQFYLRVYDETMKMRENPEEYRKSAFAKLQRIAKVGRKVL